MRIPRLFLSQHLAVGSEVVLPADAVHYVQRVLRLHDGAPIVLFNGEGGEYHGMVSHQKNAAVVMLNQFVPREIESPLALHLGQGISRGEKMDYVVQKAVELGVKELTPLITERCGVKLAAERADKRVQHWQKIAQSACEQSGRNHLPVIHSPKLLQDWLDERDELLKLVCHFDQSNQDSQANTFLNCALLIGPEGGFTDEEVAAAYTQGFQSFSLGPRVLRTETAAVVAITKVQSIWGDL